MTRDQFEQLVRDTNPGPGITADDLSGYERRLAEAAYALGHGQVLKASVNTGQEGDTPRADAFEADQRTRAGPTRYPDALLLIRQLERELTEVKALSDVKDRSGVYQAKELLQLRADLAHMTAEREQARRFGEEAARRYNELLADQRILRCAFCDAEYPPDTPPSQHEALTAHVTICAKHPMRAVEAERDAALADARRLCALLRQWRTDFADSIGEDSDSRLMLAATDAAMQERDAALADARRLTDANRKYIDIAERVIDEYADEYEFTDGDNGYYIPTEKERVLLADFGHGLMVEIDAAMQERAVCYICGKRDDEPGEMHCSRPHNRFSRERDDA